MRELTIEIEGMHCASCPLLVDDCVEDFEWVIESRTDLRTGTAVVKAEDGVTPEAVLAAVAEAGYQGKVV